MSTFDTDGFLSDDLKEIRQTVRRSHSDLLLLCRRINHLAYEFRRLMKVARDNLRQVVTACLFARILHGYQATIVLCEDGLGVDANVVGRSLLEALFIIMNVARDESFVERYVKSDFLERRRFINAIRADTRDAFEPKLKVELTESFIVSIEDTIQTENIQRMTTEELARQVGLETTYQYAYRVLSSDVHVSSRSLTRYLVLDEIGDLSALDDTPRTDDLERLLVVSSEMMLLAMDRVATLWGLEKEDELQELHRTILDWPTAR